MPAPKNPFEGTVGGGKTALELWWEWRKSLPGPDPFEMAMGFVGGTAGRGGIIGKNVSKRQRITDLFSKLGETKPKQLKRTSPQGNKKLRETVANEEENLFKPEGEGFQGSFRTLGPRDEAHFVRMFHTREIEGLPGTSWYAERGLPPGLRDYHRTILENPKLKVGKEVALPLPVNKLTPLRGGGFDGRVWVKKTAADAKSATILDFKR